MRNCSLHPDTLSAMRRLSAYERLHNARLNTRLDVYASIDRAANGPTATPMGLQTAVDRCGVALIGFAVLAFTLAGLLAIFG
jgi:hypothetical protein